MKLKKLNKKAGVAVLAEPVVKALIAVIVILLLVGLIWKIVDSLIAGNSEKKQAQKQLDYLMAQIKSLEDGSSRDVIIENPKNWEIILWPNEERPDARFSNCLEPGEFCLCICPESSWSNAYEICSEKGVCESFHIEGDEDAFVNPPRYIIIDGTTLVKLTFKNKEYVLERG